MTVFFFAIDFSVHLLFPWGEKLPGISFVALLRGVAFVSLIVFLSFRVRCGRGVPRKSLLGARTRKPQAYTRGPVWFMGKKVVVDPASDACEYHEYEVYSPATSPYERERVGLGGEHVGTPLAGARFVVMRLAFGRT